MELIFQSVSKIIPDEFEPAHTRSFDLWIKSTVFTPNSSKVLNQYLEIPLKINSSEIYFTGFETRLSISHYSGEYRFQTIVYRNQNQGRNFVVDLQGHVLLR